MLKPLRALPSILALFLLLPASSWANNTAQTLPFSQSWTNIGLITANDDWSGVPGIEGFRGDGLAGGTGVNPQTILVPDTPGVLDVNANQTAPNMFATGGATELHIADPVVALAGSGTARAPYLKLYLNTTGQSGITISYNLRDIDGSTDDSIQQVALHFRVGSSGNFTDVPAAYVADASSGPNLATLVTPVCVVLPAAAGPRPAFHGDRHPLQVEGVERRPAGRRRRRRWRRRFQCHPDGAGQPPPHLDQQYRPPRRG